MLYKCFLKILENFFDQINKWKNHSMQLKDSPPFYLVFPRNLN